MDIIRENAENVCLNVCSNYCWSVEFGYKISGGVTGMTVKDSHPNVKYTKAKVIYIIIKNSNIELYNKLLSALKNESDIEICGNPGDGMKIVRGNVKDGWKAIYELVTKENIRLESVYYECTQKLGSIGCGWYEMDEPNYIKVPDDWFHITTVPADNLGIGFCCKEGSQYYNLA